MTIMLGTPIYLLAQLAGKFLPATPTCVSTPNHTMLKFACHRIFVSEDKLCDHINEIHPGPTGRTREELIEEEEARACAV